MSVSAPSHSDGVRAVAMEVSSRATRHVRTRTRSAAYFEHADRFAAAFLGPLGLSPSERDVVGIDIPVLLDDCYEALVTESEYHATAMSALTEHLHRVLDPDVAATELPGFASALESNACALETVASAVLASTTVRGRASVAAAAGDRAADDWVGLWREHVTRHNRQQERHSRSCALIHLTVESDSPRTSDLAAGLADLTPRSRSFRDGVREYVASHADTAAAAMALVGALPFAAGPAGEARAELLDFFRSCPRFLAAMNQLFRFAQDVHFDSLEPLSAGVFALAAERGCSVAALDARALDGDHLTRSLRSEWQIFADEQRSLLTELAEHRWSRNGSPDLASAARLSPVLVRILDVSFRIAEALTRASHKA